MHPGITYADIQALSFQKGDENALAFFFDELYAGLCIYGDYYTRNIDAAKDIVMEAFLAIWKTRSQFSTAGSVRAYLYTVVRREACKWRKAQGKVVRMEDGLAEAVSSWDENTPFANLVRAETIRHLHQAINSLPTQCRKVFQLLYLEGKSIKEIASILHLSPSTVKTQKQRGLAALRKSMTFPFSILIAVFLQKIFAAL